MFTPFVIHLNYSKKHDRSQEITTRPNESTRTKKISLSIIYYDRLVVVVRRSPLWMTNNTRRRRLRVSILSETRWRSSKPRRLLWCYQNITSFSYHYVDPATPPRHHQKLHGDSETNKKCLYWWQSIIGRRMCTAYLMWRACRFMKTALNWRNGNKREPWPLQQNLVHSCYAFTFLLFIVHLLTDINKQSTSFDNRLLRSSDI